MSSLMRTNRDEISSRLRVVKVPQPVCLSAWKHIKSIANSTLRTRHAASIQRTTQASSVHGPSKLGRYKSRFEISQHVAGVDDALIDCNSGEHSSRFGLADYCGLVGLNFKQVFASLHGVTGLLEPGAKLDLFAFQPQ